MMELKYMGVLKTPSVRIGGLNPPLATILAEDKVQDLIIAYNKCRKLINGRTISDLSFVVNQLKSWTTIAEAEMIIPFHFSRKRPVVPTCTFLTNSRVYWLSHRKGTKQYYFGEFFDLKVSGNKKKVRKYCRLSKEAIKFFKIPEVKRNESIETS
jgi:hypothetical protein